MSVQTPNGERSIVSGQCPRHSVRGVDGRQITRDRYVRALTAPCAIEPVTDHFWVADGTAEYHHVDTERGRCDCPDATYRSGLHCYHAISAAIAEIVARGVTSEFTARVAHAARRWGCPAGGHECNGPLALTDHDSIPCPTCVSPVLATSARLDEYDVWQRLTGGRL